MVPECGSSDPLPCTSFLREAIALHCLSDSVCSTLLSTYPKGLASYRKHIISNMSSPSISDHSPPPSPPPDSGYNPDDPDQPTEDIRDQSTAAVTNSRADVDDLSDNDSVLSDVDEAQFEDFDPNQVAIEERPIAVDEDTVKLLGRHKRKRADGEVDGDGGKKKKKEGKREKVKKARKRQDSDDDFSGGQEVEGKRVRKRKAFTEEGGKPRKEKQKPRKPSPENEEELDPEERKLVQERYSLVEHGLK